jgi:transglutaminase-like putative cysteine protease
MTIKSLVIIFAVFSNIYIFSQENLYSSASIPANLKQNSNAVVRLHEINVSMNSVNNMDVSEKRIITVLNKEGDDNIDAYVHYDNNVKIKELEVLVYNQFGVEIKHIKKNDFKDVSAVDGGTLYSDSRVKYLEYTPISYPYTLEFKYSVNTTNTAFIEPFMPINSYFLSVQNSSYTINFPPELGIRTKEMNLQGLEVVKEELPNKISFTLKNIEAMKPEEFSPILVDMCPKVLFASKKFTLEGVSAQVENWNDFGKWIYDDLLKGTSDLSAETIALIQNLVKDEKNNIDKAKKIYQYVQDKSRYISVQVGIGGWKPFNASEVDRLSYGDCKGLTNYTMSLLKAANIESNYTVLYAGDNQRNMDADFASMQGNHAILSIPTESDTLWLECTSQKAPFGFIGNFTDDRDVLVVTSEGGKIQRTKKYTTDENTQILKGHYTISNAGDIDVKVNLSSKGIQYDDKYMYETENKRDLDTYYKKRWNYVNGITINNMQITNNKDEIAFIEDINFMASNYSNKAGDRMLITLNALNRLTQIPDRYRDRKFPLKIKRGFKDVDEVEIKLPSDYKIEAMPNNVSIENKFGSFSVNIEKKDDYTLIYKREFVLNDGEFPKEDYEAFRDFNIEVSKQDNAKVVLIKNQN